MNNIIKKIDTIEILGVKINNLSLQQLFECVSNFLNSENTHYIVTPNPEMIVDAQKDNDFKKILNAADIALPDGFGLVLASFILYKKPLHRITGADFTLKLAHFCEKNNYSIYLFGSSKDTLQKTIYQLKIQFPNLVIKGFNDGGIINNPKNVNQDIIDDINFKKPDVLLVALGHNKQEKFIYYQLNKFIHIKLAIGVGGTFDYISHKVKRAPRIFQLFGLEWLYRLIHQPQRMRRIYRAIFVFLYEIFKERFNYAKND